MIFKDFGIGPVPKKVRVGSPSHIGTAVGGFGFSTTGFAEEVSLTAFSAQLVNSKAEHRVITIAPHRRRPTGKERFSKGGSSLKTETNKRTPSAAILRYKLLPRAPSAQLRRRRAIRWGALRRAHARSRADLSDRL